MATKLVNTAEVASSEAQTLVAVNPLRRPPLFLPFRTSAARKTLTLRQWFPAGHAEGNQHHEVPRRRLREERQVRQGKRTRLFNLYLTSPLTPSLSHLQWHGLFFSFQVNKLEEMVQEMVASYEDCAAMAQAIKAVPVVYQPSDQVGVLPAVRIEAI